MIFEKELGIKFNLIEKPNSNSIEENNSLLWAKQIFKTKPNNELSSEFKNKIKTVFHHLTKEELIDKLLANHLLQNKQNSSKTIKSQ
jgi:ATP-dependent RNA helicase DeaD